MHVLCTNETAIRFYEKRNFQKRIYLPRYYTINNELKDGYCYVLYLKDARPPFRISYPFFKKRNFVTVISHLNYFNTAFIIS